MIRRVIRIPRTRFRETLGQRTISDRGQVADLLGCALRKHGCNPTIDGPARWAFGVIARSLAARGTERYFAIEAIHLGSSEPSIARAIAALRPEDLVLDKALPGWELDLRCTEIHDHPDPPHSIEALACYCISPIRVTRMLGKNRQEDITTLTDDFGEQVNRTMGHRFGRSFHLKLLPDRIYVRSRGGEVSAGFAIKTRPNGTVVVKRGIALPFTLVGPTEDVRDAWYSGLGRTTALGFGMLGMQS